MFPFFLWVSLALAQSPGAEAARDLDDGHARPKTIQNRFFLKEGRFEIAPTAGLVPNNPFARRYVSAVVLAWHMNEQLAVEGDLQYSPDAGVSDLKPLTRTLVQIAQGGGAEFQQPLDKVTLGASFGVRYAPLYGKISLAGATVLNFDVYGAAALGMVSKTSYYAASSAIEPVALYEQGNEVKFAPVIGAGFDLFLTQSVALKIDARSAFYVDNFPDYEPGVENERDGDQRLYDNLVASVGVGCFFPRMQPRVANF